MRRLIVCAALLALVVHHSRRADNTWRFDGITIDERDGTLWASQPLSYRYRKVMK